MQKGIIVGWYSTVASIPAGFHLCDGAAGTPDLRDKFIISAKQDDGGIAKATIEGALQQSGGAVNHNHALGAGNQIIDSTPGGNFSDDSSNAPNYPPCYALCLIMKL